MKNRLSYHTSIKIMEYNGSLPQNIRMEIPKVNLHRWRNTPPEHYEGFNLGSVVMINKFLHRNESFRMIRMYMKMCKFVQEIAKPVMVVCKKHRLYRDKLVFLFEAIIEKFPKKITKVLMGRFKSTFYRWKKNILNRCITITQKCRKRYPNQLTAMDVDILAKTITKKELADWPMISRYWYLRRNNILHISKTTFRRYYNKLGILCSKIKKPKYGIGVRADAPNKIWHIDVTIVKLRGNFKVYIYAVIDNYSRYIINIKVSDKLCKKIRKQTLKECFLLFKQVPENLQVWADGGSENKNKMVMRYLKRKGVSFIEAQKDTPLSNSIIESSFRLLKMQYLKYKKYENIQKVKEIIKNMLEEYNFKRPHNSLNGSTPFECWTANEIDHATLTQQMKEAKKDRTAWNRNAPCPGLT